MGSLQQHLAFYLPAYLNNINKFVLVRKNLLHQDTHIYCH